MSELIERLQGIAGTSDHERGCAGREYSCSCGFDDLVEELCDKAQSALRTQAATIAQLQAELSEAREVPGRIVAWLRSIGDWPLATSHAELLANAIEARDWSKPDGIIKSAIFGHDATTLFTDDEVRVWSAL